jgi:LPS-assembly lipoprotein
MKLRSVLLLVSCLTLAACSGSGYRPLYGTLENGQNVNSVLSQINVLEQRTRSGQLVRNELLTGLANDGTARFQLKLDVTETTGGVSTNPGTTVVRKRFNLSVHYELSETGKGDAISAGTSFANVSYDTVRQPVADLEAAENAKSRAAIQVGQDIRQRLAAFIATHQK